MISLTEILSRRLHQRDITRLVNEADIEEVYALIFSMDDRIAYNALWVLTHLRAKYNPWLTTRRNALMNMLLKEAHIGKKRLLFNLLNRLPMTEENVRTDYLDFAFEKSTLRSLMPSVPLPSNRPTLRRATSPNSSTFYTPKLPFFPQALFLRVYAPRSAA